MKESVPPGVALVSRLVATSARRPWAMGAGSWTAS